MFPSTRRAGLVILQLLCPRSTMSGRVSSSHLSTVISGRQVSAKGEEGPSMTCESDQQACDTVSSSSSESSWMLGVRAGK